MCMCVSMCVSLCVCARARTRVCVCMCACVGQAYTVTTTVMMIAATMSATIITASIHVNGELETVGPTVGSTVGLTVGSGRASIVTTFGHREGSNVYLHSLRTCVSMQQLECTGGDVL